MCGETAVWHSTDPSICGRFFCDKHMPTPQTFLTYSSNGFAHDVHHKYVSFNSIDKALNETKFLLRHNRDSLNISDVIIDIYMDVKDDIKGQYCDINAFQSKLGLLINTWIRKPKFSIGEFFISDKEVTKFFRKFKSRLVEMTVSEESLKIN